MGNSNSGRVRGVFFTFMAAALWGTSFPVIKWGLTYISVCNFVMLRFLISILILTPIVVALNRKNFLIHLKNRYIILLGFLNAVSYFLQFIGQQWTTVTKTALLVNSSVIFASISSYFWLKEKMEYLKASGIITAFLGMFLIVTCGNLKNLQSGNMIGDLFCLLSGATWGLYIVISKRILNKENETLFFINVMLIYTFIFILMFSSPFLRPIELNFEVFVAVLYIGFFCTVLPFLLWYEGLKTVEASSSATYLLLTIVVATIISIIFLRESLTLTLVLGALLICLGIWLVERGNY